MEDLGAAIIATIITIGIILTVLIVSYKIDSNIDNDKWNGGYHQCGGKWVYEQAVGHRYSTNYIYKCDKCNMREEFSEYRNN